MVGVCATQYLTSLLLHYIARTPAAQGNVTDSFESTDKRLLSVRPQLAISCG